MKFPDFCTKCGVSIRPDLDGFLEHIRTEQHNGGMGNA